MRAAPAHRAAPPRPGRERRRAPACRPVAVGGRSTLDQLISGAWAAVSAGAPVACPLCGGRMEPSPGDGACCVACTTALS